MSTTTNLVIEHIAQNQKQKEVTANEGFDFLDQAIANVGSHSLVGEIGVLTQGGIFWTGAADRKVAHKVTVTGTGTMTKITASFDSAGVGNARGVLYTVDGSGDPDTLVDVTNVVNNPGAGWVDFTFASPPTVTPGDYFIGLHMDFAADIESVNTGATIYWYDADTYSDGTATTWDSTATQDEILSIKATIDQLVSSVWTMSDAQMRDALHIVSGVLVANTEIVVPNRTKLYCIFNNTTGAFNLDVKTAAGAGTRITQTSKAWMYCDGTDVFPIVNTGGTKL